MKKLVGRIIAVIPALSIQIAWYVMLFRFFDSVLQQHLMDLVNVIFSFLAVLFVIALISKRDESSYKLLWAIVIVSMPILGAILYLLLGNKNTGKNLKKQLKASADVLSGSLKQDDSIELIKDKDLRTGQVMGHIADNAGFPVYKNGSAQYFPFGEKVFESMCEDLRSAKEYIYVEYFIIHGGKFWDTIADIMVKKAAEGVDVRVIYDDFGSVTTFSAKDLIEWTKKGLKFSPFNPFLFIRSQLNNRDHRKILVIDGKVAYSGGINVGDEYINETHPFGIWKDIGFRITGDAVNSYTYMFVEFWNAFSKEKISFKPVAAQAYEADGFIQPYYDSPIRSEHTSNVFFTEVLSMATDYVWFYTPYLMLGDALFDAFIRAAQRGVDVRIIMPGIPDKKLVFKLSRSYYRDLINAGVKIYEYDPGFVHAKACIADDKIAGIGTVNLDYRSLFLHFECECIFYEAGIIKALKEDYLKTQSECTQRTIESIKNDPLTRLGNGILRVFAPLM